MDFQSLVSLVWTNLILPSLFSNIEIIDKKGRNSVELRQNKVKVIMYIMLLPQIILFLFLESLDKSKTKYPINIFYVYMWILRYLLVFLRGNEFFRFSRISKYRELHASHRYSSYTFSLSRLISARCLLTGEFSTMYLKLETEDITLIFFPYFHISLFLALYQVRLTFFSTEHLSFNICAGSRRP